MGAVIFIIVVSAFLAYSITGSFSNCPINDKERIIRSNSYLYASEYLNSDEVIIEEAYADEVFLENSNVVLHGGAFLSNSSPVLTTVFSEQRNGIVIYKVQPGDIPSEIAEDFGISTNTLLWANDLSAWDYIKPGQELIILPVSGVQHTVKQGETLEKIVEKYKGDLAEVIKFNGLPANGNLATGEEIIIPGGQKSVPYYPQTSSYASYNFSRPYAQTSHRFPWGQCTWYVAQKRYIPWSGHAKTWIYKAPQYGFATGDVPKPGAIMATRENSYYGHVAYVEAVNGPYVTISEMHLGQGIRRVRTLHVNDWRIIGYIY